MGSEMCIRDSLSVPPFASEQSGVNGANNSERACVPSHPCAVLVLAVGAGAVALSVFDFGRVRCPVDRQLQVQQCLRFVPKNLAECFGFGVGECYSEPCR